MLQGFTRYVRSKESFDVKFGVILISSLIVRIIDVNRPFTEYFRYINCQYGVYARNYVWYGYLTTKFAQVANPYPTTPAFFEYYFHHPPLLSLWISLFFRIFGISEAALRLAEITINLAIIYMVYRLSYRLWDKQTAYLATIIFAFMPMTVYYSRIAAPDYSALPFVLLTLYHYVNWAETGEWRYLTYTGISLFIGAWMDWQAYLIVVGILTHALMFKVRDKRSLIIALLLSTAIAFLTYGLFVVISGGITQLVELYHGFLTRAGFKSYPNFNPGGVQYSFTMYQFITTELTRSVTLFTSVALLLSIVWFMSFVYKDTRKDSYVIPLFVHGVISVFLFRQGAYLHDFWLFQLAPAIGISAGRAVFIILDEFKGLLTSSNKTPSPLFCCGGYIILSLTLAVFASAVINSVYGENIDFNKLEIIMWSSFVVMITLFMLISRTVGSEPHDPKALAVVSPLFLLFCYSRNLVYPYIPFYGWILLPTSVVMLLFLLQGFRGKIRWRVVRKVLIVSLLTIFLAESAYTLHIRNSWSYPVEYNWGNWMNSNTLADEGILVIPELSTFSSYLATYYAERRVDIVSNLRQFSEEINSNISYQYLIANKEFLTNPKYACFSCYLLTHYPVKEVMGEYVFDLQGTSSAVIFSLKSNVNFAQGIILNNFSIIRVSKSEYALCYNWVTTERIRENYTIFVHFVKGGRIAFQQDHPPCVGECPTDSWIPSRQIYEVYIISPPPGEYRIYLGMWLPSSGKKLPVKCECNDGDNRAFLGTVTFK